MRRRSRKSIFCIFAALCFLTTATGWISAAWAEPAAVNLDFTLPVPEDPQAAAYLGLDQPGNFSLDQVRADILIVEIFSMYCPICQREAPRVNALFEKLNSIKGKKVRVLGIGAGNSTFEVGFFKETYAIPFPLFSDGDFYIHKKIGERGTPFFIAIIPDAPKGNRIFFTHSGDMGDLDAFFDKLVDSAQIQPTQIQPGQ